MNAKKDRHDPTRRAAGAPMSPRSPMDARRAEEEARQQAAATGAELFHAQQRGKVEAETRRISGEMTRGAQERLRAAQPAPSALPAGEAQTAREPRVESVPAAPLPAPMSVKHIAVPLDGSAFAERALPYVVAFARLMGARLTLVHVDSIPGALDTLISGAGAESQQSEGIRPYLERLRHQVSLPRQRIHVVFRRAPSPAQGIRTLEEEGLADLVALATHAREGMERALLGSVADELLRTGRAPLLLVSPHVAAPLEDTPIFSHVLVTVDGSALSEQALGGLGGVLALAPDAERSLRDMTLLTVVEHPSLVADGEAYLATSRRQIETQYATHGLAIHTVTVVGEPADVIAGVAPWQHVPTDDVLTADLLVLATHARGGVRRWLLGSVASTVVARAALPVLLVHPVVTGP